MLDSGRVFSKIPSIVPLSGPETLVAFKLMREISPWIWHLYLRSDRSGERIHWSCSMGFALLHVQDAPLGLEYLPIHLP